MDLTELAQFNGRDGGFSNRIDLQKCNHDGHLGDPFRPPRKSHPPELLIVARHFKEAIRECAEEGGNLFMLKAVRKKRAYEDIVKQIRHLIEKGRLKRDDQLPTERELSETFKVSRATVREAIFSLETMKLVERRQGDGTYVIASSEEALVQPLATSLFHEKDDMIDIFSLRKIIEPEVAQLASENRTPEEINELEEILKEQEKRWQAA